VAADTPPADVPPMFPLMLDVTGLSVMVVGGAGIRDRLAALDESGARRVAVFSENADPALAAAAGKRLTPRLPTEVDFARLRPALLFVADLEDNEAAKLRAAGHGVGALVHVQDRLALCDFHMPARLRRGHLQVAVSTDGVAPGLSRLVRDFLAEHVLGPQWTGRVTELADERRKWKEAGLSFAALARNLSDYVSAKGWLRKP
jgi:precorrin-2 dehydrogenase/sirohydrochlorin ferrochelatase